MKKLILPVLCVLALYISGCGPQEGPDNEPGNENETYVNEKFGFEVEYPSKVLIAQGEVSNGYGQEFHTDDAEAVLKTYGKFNTSDIDLEKSYEQAQNGDVTDKSLDEQARMFSVSGVHSGTVYNIKTYLVDDVFIVYEFRYPESKKDIYGPINKEISESFKVL